MSAVAGAFAAAAPFMLVHAQAPSWPARPIRLIVISAPGGASDIMARLLGEQLGAGLGQTIVIDNRPSAGGIVGTELAAKAAPDGYTLLLGSPAAFAIAPHLNPRLPYDPARDFVPVGQFSSLAFALIAHPGLPVHSVRELLALAKARPGSINVASAGNATTTHLVAELFKSATALDVVHVPFKGAAPAMAALAGGQVQVMFDALVTSVPQVRSGKVRALAVTGRGRSTLLPGVPTMAEAGVASFVVGSWFGVFAPARTPAAYVQRLNAEIAQAAQAPKLRERLAALGAEAASGSAAAFGRFVREESDRFGRLIASANIRLD
ncbi:MAG: tripartite tricarboxylate transporter substrate binding protein [Burkholderiales bacterium]|nr:tripartite tricarboxylate transporter substrate binding protein [Burkholderiales bacterium]